MVERAGGWLLIPVDGRAWLNVPVGGCACLWMVERGGGGDVAANSCMWLRAVMHGRVVVHSCAWSHGLARGEW